MSRSAIEKQNLAAIGYAILTMLLVIIAYDQLLFRPIVAWADKFRFEQTASGNRADILDARPVPPHARAARADLSVRGAEPDVLESAHQLRPARLRLARESAARRRACVDALWFAVIVAGTAYAAWRAYQYLSASLGSVGRPRAPSAMACITLARVVVLIALATLIWVPVGVWIGLRPKLAERIQPLAQFLAAFPANLAFPVFVVADRPLRPERRISG